MSNTFRSRKYARRSFDVVAFVLGMSMGLARVDGVLLIERLDGLRGIGGFDGDAGRLVKVLTVGGMGVLDGRSMDSGRFLREKDGDTLESPVR